MTSSGGDFSSHPDSSGLRDQILEEALNLRSADRKAFVRRVCAGDADMEAELFRLLEANAAMESGFLEEPPPSHVIDPLTPGHKIGRYQLEGKIGSGGTSVVYRVRDTTDGSPAALKLITTTLVDSEQVRRCFLGEVKTLLAVQHGNIVRVYDWGEYEGQPYLAMELLEGENLGSAIQNGRAGAVSTKLDIARQIARALACVHEAGILHRDIKPSNIFLERSGRVKLMDFGVSRLLEPGVSHASTFAGTLQYMAPEQVAGGPASRATDMYAYGVLLYELFTGNRPPASMSMASRLGEGGGPFFSSESLETAGLPPALVEIITEATSGQPTNRPATFHELERQLAAVQLSASTPTIDAQPRRKWTVLAIVCSSLLAAAFLIVRYRTMGIVPTTIQSPLSVSIGSPREEMRAVEEFDRLLESGTGVELRSFADAISDGDRASKARARARELDALSQLMVEDGALRAKCGAPAEWSHRFLSDAAVVITCDQQSGKGSGQPGKRVQVELRRLTGGWTAKVHP